MKLIKKDAEIFVPDNKEVGEALARTTHLAVSAHQDDIEMMAFDGILKCFGRQDKWFTGAVVTNGSGSPRNGIYEKFSDEEMKKIRSLEQKKAAFSGEYSAQVLFKFDSSEVKDPKNEVIVEQIKELLFAARPEIVYTHNPFDKHDTHVGVAVKVIKAIKELPKEIRPLKVYGCEIWRGLDWLSDDEKVLFDVGGRENIALAIIGVFDSQITGGKDYHNAIMGRWKANATFCKSHRTDTSNQLSYALDMTEMVYKDIDLKEYARKQINKFMDDVEGRLNKLLG